MQRFDIVEPGSITDKYFVTYGIFYLMGILTFVPNNFFVIANDYWMFKFRDPVIDSKPEIGGPPNRTPLQANFISSIYAVCQITNMFAIMVAAVLSPKLPPPERKLMGSLSCALVFFIVNLIFVPLNTDEFQQAFFTIVIFIAIVLNISVAVTIVSLFELVTKFPISYFAAIQSGQALCGIFSSLTQIMTLSLDQGSIRSGFIYFGLGTAIVAFTIVFYFVSRKKSQYYIYHTGHGINEQFSAVCVKLDGMREVLSTTKWYMIALVIVAGASATVYPGVIGLVVAMDKDLPMDHDGPCGTPWVERYFVPVVSYLLYHLFDFIGRELAGRLKKPTSGKLIMVMALLRIGLIPLLLLCNVQPRRRAPVVLGDVAYAFIIICLSFSNGFLINLCMVTVPTKVTHEEDKPLAAVMTLLCTVTSTGFCSFLSLLMINVI